MTTRNREELTRRLQDVLDGFVSVARTGSGAVLRIEAALAALGALEKVCADLGHDPYPVLAATFETLAALPRRAQLADGAQAKAAPARDLDRIASVDADQLARNSWGPGALSGSRCFVSGCRSGAMPIAMAKAGAREVVAASARGDVTTDLRAAFAGLVNSPIETLSLDLSDLRQFPSDSFDLVVLDAALHRTVDPDRSLREHFRITRVGGTLWLHAYGSGGLYWTICDKLRGLLDGIDPTSIRDLLPSLSPSTALSEIFTDRLLSPRPYYRYYHLKQVLDILRPLGNFSYAMLNGDSPRNDTALLLATDWGREMFGPDGEIRIAVTKSSPHRVPVTAVPGTHGDIALITQMRAGTHFVCAAFRTALAAQLYKPTDFRQYDVMGDDYILRGLHRDGALPLPPVNPARHVYFSHYYHPHHAALPPMPRVFLIGFPLDSFYSDGILHSDGGNDPAPSSTKAHAENYVFRYGSPEWRFLEPFMHQNAEWLLGLHQGADELIVRYEDFYTDFDGVARRLEQVTGTFANPLPKPTLNPKRLYWSERYRQAFDQPGLEALWKIFSPAIERFYPEKLSSLKAALSPPT